MTQSASTQTVERRWMPPPRAEAIVCAVLDEVLQRTPAAQELQRRLLMMCGVKLRDLVDCISLPSAPAAWTSAGWRRCAQGIWRHDAGRLPDLIDREQICVAVRVESLDLFLKAHGLDAPIEGPPHGPYRRARLFAGDGVALNAVERNGWDGLELPQVTERLIRRARVHLQSLRTRRRQFRCTARGLAQTRRLVDSLTADLGSNWAAALFMRSEREYWEANCEAGALQSKRQVRAGIGWANADHHRYVCSRDYAHNTIAILESLGFERREYCSNGYGGGAQMMEHPVLRVTASADVDWASNDEDCVAGPLSPLITHGNAGLWAVLHGESILDAGLRSVAGLYDVRAIRRQFQSRGIAMEGAPDHTSRLRSRTQGQRRAVDPRRVDGLERAKYLNRTEAEAYRLNGALASYLECTQYEEGFQGVRNQAANQGR